MNSIKFPYTILIISDLKTNNDFQSRYDFRKIKSATTEIIAAETEKQK